MKNILEKLQNWLAGPFSAKVQKLTTNPYMRALQSCFTTILPMIIVGSLSTLIGTLKNFLSFIPDLSMINNLSIIWKNKARRDLKKDFFGVVLLPPISVKGVII